MTPADVAARPVWARALALEALFAGIQRTRMQGVPVLHPGLHVVAIGFEADPSGQGAFGVLVTPWFMNLVWLPLAEAPQDVLGVGHKRTRQFGEYRFEFIGADEEGFGPFEACSLFSPMAEFVDQAAAEATAREVLALLRRPPEPAPEAPPPRRAFLFGSREAAR